ncbi:hypothetical protein [Haloferax volcanii]|uniref:hypothetical protein n=1 Tax=Haloferax volcanii TaxID=2246 RepID=UPI001981E267|nr:MULTISPECIES: hypothetical protein [Haloferax]
MSGATIGLASCVGLTSARGSTEKRQNHIEAKIDTTIENGVKYVVSLARNKKTDEIDGVILPVSVDDRKEQPLKLAFNDSDSDLYEVSDDVLAQVQESVFEAKSDTMVTKETTERQDMVQTDIWGPLRDIVQRSDPSRGDIETQEESLLEDVVKEIAAGTKDSINRIGAYYIKSPEGTECDASANSNPHRQLGVSIDYEKKLGEFTETAVTGVLGAVLGAFLAGLAGAALGGLLGAIVGFGIKYLKDTTNATFAYRDIDKCALSACSPFMKPLVSGIWMDEDTDLLEVDIGESDLPAVHLENGAQVDVGFRDELKISS